MPIAIDPESCRIFSWPHSKEKEHNEKRLLYRQFLEKLVQEAWPSLSQSYTFRSSLTHPHVHNNFNVSSVRVHLGRKAKENKELQTYLGKEFADVIKSPGRNLHIYAKLDESGLSCGLTIPAEAWWDFSLLKEDVNSPNQELYYFLKETLPEGILETPAWVSAEKIGELDPVNWNALLNNLKPGEHRFSISLSHGFLSDPESFLKVWAKPLDTIVRKIRWKI